LPATIIASPEPRLVEVKRKYDPNSFFSNRSERPAGVAVFLEKKMSNKPVGFRGIKVIALSVLDLARANKFYGENLALEPAYEADQHVGYLIGDTILMLKSTWDQSPTKTPNPRVTIITEDAKATEKELLVRGVVISDPVELYDDVHQVGSFLDTEGNTLWFCS
jgi:catechol 2,3-dioxygenase-like lactoylglutathione lyase family enzyme